ncbi:MAG TPA: PPOX class F420-dependent oxidoreductase [Acidimicrobiales bacterium]
MSSPITLSEAALAFVAERQYASLTTLRPDGSPHVTPVGFTWDAERGLARVITFSAARKARNVAARPGGRAVLCQLDGGRWLTLEGPATLSDDPDRVAEAVRRYTERYRPPKPRPDRVVIEIAIDRVIDRV